MGLDVDRSTDLAVAEIRRLADTCRGADPATPVPSCPGWDLAELQRHTGEVNRWAARMVVERSERRLPRERIDWGTPSEPEALPDWVAAGAELVESSFRGADPDVPMWTWGWPKTAGFWPRRMVHETGVHRADAELALGRAPSYDEEIAADGVDELLDNIPHAAYFRPDVAELRGDGQVLGFAGGGASWRITLEPEGFSWKRGEGPADAALETPTAGDLLLVLYQRRAVAPGEVGGDRSLIEHWLANSVL